MNVSWSITNCVQVNGQYKAIDIYLKLTNLMLLLSSSKLFPLNAQVED